MVEQNGARRTERTRLIPFPSTIPIVMVGLSILLVGLLYIMVLSPEPIVEESGDPCDLMAGAVSPTQARVGFEHLGAGPGSPSCQTDFVEKLFEEAWPLALRVVLSNGTHSGTYTFPSFDDGALLVLSSGDEMGTISYRDFAGNKEIDYGDELRLENLGRESSYRLDVVWDPTHDVIAVANFHTP